MTITDIAIDNKYTKYYLKIVNNAKLRANTKTKATKLLGYVESHHILPKSIHPNNDTVYLSIREHFICHRLLCKILTGSDLIKMEHAMTFLYPKRTLNSRQVAIAMSYKHRPCSDTRRENIKSARLHTKKITCPYCDKTCDPGNYKRFHGDNCKHNPNIDISILSERSKIATKSYNTQRATNQFNKPKPKHGDYICPHCNKRGTNFGAMSRHHFDNCKFRNITSHSDSV